MTQQEKKYQDFLERRKTLIRFGIKNGFIKHYDDALIENLRQFEYAGVPASIIILCDELCEGRCYDRAQLVTLGFKEDDFCVALAEINSLRLNPKNKNSTHYFAERTDKDGKVWVYDTSLGAVFEKSLYYQIEEPKKIDKLSKDKVLKFLDEELLKQKNLEINKFVAPTMIPMAEKIAKSTKSVYKKQLLKEIELAKEKSKKKGKEREF